jgi:hypothetical protein
MEFQWQKVCDTGRCSLSDNERGSSENDLSIQRVQPESISLRAVPEGGLWLPGLMLNVGQREFFDFWQ